MGGRRGVEGGGWRGRDGRGWRVTELLSPESSSWLSMPTASQGPPGRGACSLLGKRLVNYCTGIVLAMELQ